MDYLLKPFDDERFTTVLRRAKRRIREARTGALQGRIERLLELMEDHDEVTQAPGEDEGKDYLTHIVVRVGERSLLQVVDEIDWLGAADYCVEIHVGDRVHVVRRSLGRLMRQLDPSRFVRIHRSTAVRLGAVREVRPYLAGAYTVILHDGTRLRLSRRRRHGLEAALGQRI